MFLLIKEYINTKKEMNFFIIIFYNVPMASIESGTMYHLSYGMIFVSDMVYISCNFDLMHYCLYVICVSETLHTIIEVMDLATTLLFTFLASFLPSTRKAYIFALTSTNSVIIAHCFHLLLNRELFYLLAEYCKHC